MLLLQLNRILKKIMTADLSSEKPSSSIRAAVSAERLAMRYEGMMWSSVDPTSSQRYVIDASTVNGWGSTGPGFAIGKVFVSGTHGNQSLARVALQCNLESMSFTIQSDHGSGSGIVKVHEDGSVQLLGSLDAEGETQFSVVGHPENSTAVILQGSVTSRGEVSSISGTANAAESLRLWVPLPTSKPVEGDAKRIIQKLVHKNDYVAVRCAIAEQRAAEFQDGRARVLRATSRPSNQIIAHEQKERETLARIRVRGTTNESSPFPITGPHPLSLSTVMSAHRRRATSEEARCGVEAADSKPVYVVNGSIDVYLPK